jgi:hypothetical protein
MILPSPLTTPMFRYLHVFDIFLSLCVDAYFELFTDHQDQASEIEQDKPDQEAKFTLLKRCQGVLALPKITRSRCAWIDTPQRRSSKVLK